ncbi:MAG: hypothetical protein HRU12_00135 [Phaeodactylibacter sp.]|nr:hypothetical protein [Phaeodactylibacter sp.]
MHSYGIADVRYHAFTRHFRGKEHISTPEATEDHLLISSSYGDSYADAFCVCALQSYVFFSSFHKA